MDHEVPQVLVVQRVLMVLEAQLAHLVDKESKATAVQAGEKELMAQEEKTDSTGHVAQMEHLANLAKLACPEIKENKAMTDLLAEADLLVNLVFLATLDFLVDPDLQDLMASLDQMEHKDHKEALVQLGLESIARNTTKLMYESCE